jgi:tryptophan-rich sensory protein
VCTMACNHQYFGTATKANRVKWAVCALLFAMGCTGIIGYVVSQVHQSTALASMLSAAYTILSQDVHYVFFRRHFLHLGQVQCLLSSALVVVVVHPFRAMCRVTCASVAKSWVCLHGKAGQAAQGLQKRT